MVSVTHSLKPNTSQDAQSIEQWLDNLSTNFKTEEIAEIRRAIDFAVPLYEGATELTGVPVLQHALGTAAILVSMNLDHESLIAAILHAVPDYLDTWMEKVATTFNANIVSLVMGIARMEQIQIFSDLHKQEKADQAQQVESLRKMLLAMVDDIRVVLIKLAERTQTMHHLKGASIEDQQHIAREIRGIFAPLANRLGVWQVKWELEDLALRYLEPELYKQTAKLLDERRVDREQYIEDVKATLKQEMQQAGIQAEVSGRSKHINSIVNKMKRKKIDFSELYDVRAVRILVNDVKECYTALGIVHNLWQPIPSEFDDYIAHPKSNDYRSLHTAVVGPRGLALEVQIRTHEMHHHSELGVAAHWRYKEGGKSDAKYEEKIAWLRQILEWKEDVSDSGDNGDMVEQFKSELFQDQVYVLTPQGKVIDLPKGATPVDFAYMLHTDLGHRTRGAKVDGAIVSLNYQLKNGQRVEILAAKQGAPSRDWLNPTLGYLHSKSARAKVKHWFKHQHHDENVAQGRVQLDKELQRIGVTSVNQEKLAQRLNFNKLEDFLAAIGRGDVTSRQILGAVQEEMPAKVEAPAKQGVALKPLISKPTAARGNVGGVLVEGVDNLMTKLAKCCKPAPPDAIVGYVTLDRGVTIHRADCAAMQRVPEERKDRLLSAQWGGKQDSRFSVDIEVVAYDRQGLLRDVIELYAKEKVNVTKVNTFNRANQAFMQFSLDITDLEQLSKILALLQHLPNVISAKRRGQR